MQGVGFGGRWGGWDELGSCPSPTGGFLRETLHQSHALDPRRAPTLGARTCLSDNQGILPKNVKLCLSYTKKAQKELKLNYRLNPKP